MDKVYIVIYESYGGIQIIGVFGSKDLAGSFVTERKTNWHAPDGFNIEEWTVD